MTRPVDSNGSRAGDYASSYQERSLVVYKDLPPEPGSAAPNDTSTSTTDMALADQLAAAKDEIRRLSGINARLREKVTDTAASRTEADPLTTFRVPENVIISDFRALAYRIHNFVANYYKDESAKDFKAWAELNHSIMSNIHPDFIKMAVNKATSTWLVEAVIWNLLMTQVFSRFGPGEGRGMLWAGRYSTRLCKLSKTPTPLAVSGGTYPLATPYHINIQLTCPLCLSAYLLSSSTEAKNPERQRAFHHWRALTTSLVTTGDSQQTDYHGAVMEITDMLEDLLAPFSSTLKGNAVIKGLETIANEAVELDQTICKQQICYRFRYPAQMFNGEAESAEVVGVPVAGKAGAERKVAGESVVPYSFVITPLLDRSGGRRGEGYGSSECVILEPAQVYIGSHSKQLTLMQ